MKTLGVRLSVVKKCFCLKLHQYGLELFILPPPNIHAEIRTKEAVTATSKRATMVDTERVLEPGAPEIAYELDSVLEASTLEAEDTPENPIDAGNRHSQRTLSQMIN